MNKANLKRRLEVLQQAANSRTASDNSESACLAAKYAAMSDEELRACFDEKLAEGREPQPWDNMSLEELQWYFADIMRNITNE